MRVVGGVPGSRPSNKRRRRPGEVPEIGDDVVQTASNRSCDCDESDVGLVASGFYFMHIREVLRGWVSWLFVAGGERRDVTECKMKQVVWDGFWPIRWTWVPDSDSMQEQMQIQNCEEERRAGYGRGKVST